MLKLGGNQGQLVGKIIGTGIRRKFKRIVINRKVKLDATPVDHLVDIGAL